MLVLRVWPLVMLAAVAGCSPPKTIPEEFPGPWKEPTPEVMAVLAKNSVQGCGEFYQKEAQEYRGEFVVACTSNGKSWAVWQVWTRSGKVLGPDEAMIWKLGGPPKS